MPSLDYVHVDVFSPEPFSGNSLPVFLDAGDLEADAMLRIAQELRHFEAVFLTPTDRPDTVRARIFDLFEELPFAGHPLLGAAAALHARSGTAHAGTWRFLLGHREVLVTVGPTATGQSCVMDQGAPEFLGEVVAGSERDEVVKAFALGTDDIDPGLPLEVVSTGLRYLVVPVRPGALERARIAADLTPLLARHGAQFAVLFDALAMEMRHWNNDGVVEDVATGSAAGTVAAFCVKHGLKAPSRSFSLHQGRFTGRPSRLHVMTEGTPEAIGTVRVGGDVAVVGRGTLERLPAPASTAPGAPSGA